MKTYLLSYYPWITQHVEPQIIRDNIEIFANALASELKYVWNEDITVTVLDALEVPQQIESVVASNCQIALMNPLGFVFARKTNPVINAGAVALRIIDGSVGESYFAQIYTHVDSGIKSLKELKGKAMGYGSSQSTSNFVIPANDLRSNDIHPFVAFIRTEFLGGHDKVAVAVYDKKIDAGAGHDGVIIDLAGQPGYEDAKTKLVTLHRSAPIPSDPVVLNIKDESEYAVIQKALVSMSSKSPAKEAIAVFWGNAQGLKETSFKPYNYLLTAVTDLGLSDKDIFLEIA